MCSAVFPNWGLPVCTNNVRICKGVRGILDWANAMPCRFATAPATIGEALDVPANPPVYQKLRLAGPSGATCKSPYPVVTTPDPHPCRSTRLPIVRKPFALAISPTARWLPCAYNDRSGIPHGPIEYTGAGSLIQVQIPISGRLYHHKALRDCGLNRVEDRGIPFERAPVRYPKPQTMVCSSIRMTSPAAPLSTAKRMALAALYPKFEVMAGARPILAPQEMPVTPFVSLSAIISPRTAVPCCTSRLTTKSLAESPRFNSKGIPCALLRSSCVWCHPNSTS